MEFIQPSSEGPRIVEVFSLKQEDAEELMKMVDLEEEREETVKLEETEEQTGWFHSQRSTQLDPY